jgi:hypothetical protein
MQATTDNWWIWFDRKKGALGGEEELFGAMYFRYGVQSDAELLEALTAQIPNGTLIDRFRARRIHYITVIEKEGCLRVAPERADVEWVGLLRAVAKPMPGFGMYLVNGQPVQDMIVTTGHELCHTFFSESCPGGGAPARIANAPAKPPLLREEKICDALGAAWPEILGADRGFLEDVLKIMSELPPPSRTWNLI